MKWKPSDYYSLGAGERIVVRSFLEQYIEERKKEAEEIEKAAEKARRGGRLKR